MGKGYTPKRYRRRSLARVGRRVIRKRRKFRKVRRNFPAAKQSCMIPMRFVVDVRIPPQSAAFVKSFARFAEEGIVNDVFGYNSSPAIDRLKLWEQFAVLGMKIKWTPGNTNASTFTHAMSPIEVWTDPNTYNGAG